MRQRWIARPGCGGFTLVEVVVAVAIMAIIAAIAVVNVRGKMPLYNVDRAVSAAWAELRAARAQAISENRSVNVGVNCGSRTLSVKTDRNGNGTFESGEVSTLNLGSISGLSISATSTNGVFSPRGAFTCPTGFWKLRFTCAEASSLYVYVFAGGQVERSKESL